VGSFDHPNLFYGAKCCDGSKQLINELLLEMAERHNEGSSTIIYCATVRDAVEVCI
jgi:ATP-dependent DNA helicase RecQ